MIKKLLAFVAIAAMAMFVLPPDTADARRGGGGGGGGFRASGGGGGGFRASGGGSFRAFRSSGGGGGGAVFRPAYRPNYIVSPSVYREPRRVYSGPVYYGGGSCEWLRQRAILSGNPYWCRRYELCLSGY